MEYTFSPVTDFEKLEEAISSLYGAPERARQRHRYRGLVEGFANTFGPAERLAVFSAPGCFRESNEVKFITFTIK